MFCIARMLPTWAGDFAERFTDFVPIALWVEKWVNMAQWIVRIGDVQQAGFISPLGEDAVDGVGGHHLTHVADMNLPRWRDASIHYMASTTLADDVVGEEIRPVSWLRGRRHRSLIRRVVYPCNSSKP